MGINIVIACWAISTALVIWALHCNNKTYSDRMSLIQQISIQAKRAINEGRTRSWRVYYRPIEKVSYNRHLFLLMTFRDPSKKYEKWEVD